MKTLECNPLEALVLTGLFEVSAGRQGRVMGPHGLSMNFNTGIMGAIAGHGQTPAILTRATDGSTARRRLITFHLFVRCRGHPVVLRLANAASTYSNFQEVLVVSKTRSNQPGWILRRLARFSQKGRAASLEDFIPCFEAACGDAGNA